MKKLFLILAMGLMIAAPASLLASARLDGLAANVREVEDIDLIWLYPNKVIEYKNTVDFRLGDDLNSLTSVTLNTEWGGVISSLDGLGVIGFYVNRPFAMLNSWTGLATFPTPPVGWFSPLSVDYMLTGNSLLVPVSNSHNLDLFWADSLGGEANLGLHFSYVDDFGFFPSGVDSQVYGLSAGLGLSKGLFSQFNLHADFSFQNITGSLGGPPSHDDGIRTFKAGALAQADVETDLYLKPFVDFQVNSTDFGGLAPSPIGTSDWSLILGSSLTRNILGGKGLVSTGLTLGYENNHLNDPAPLITGSFDQVRYQLVWNACAEAGVFDWLTLRSGIATNVLARAYTSRGNPTFVDFTNNRIVFNTGFSIHFQNFTLDASVSTTSLENTVANVAPGGGIFFAPSNNLVVGTADVRYKF